MVVDAESTAGVDRGEGYAIFGEVADEAGNACNGRAKWLGGADLRADMDADAVGDQPFAGSGLVVDAACLADVDAEFVLAEAGGDVGMGFRENIRIDAKREAGFAATAGSAGGQQFQFILAFDVEGKDVGFQCAVDFLNGFAGAGKDDAASSRWGGGEDALEFAARYDVKTRTLGCEQSKDAKGGAGLHGVADQMRTMGERLLEERKAGRDLCRVVDVQRCAEVGSETIQGNLPAGERRGGAGGGERAGGKLGC